MYCTNCGSPVADDQIFCTVCGQKLEMNPAPAPAPQPAARPVSPQPVSPQPAQNYAGTQSGGFNWERLQPRSSPVGAGSLIFAVGILLAALFLVVWGTAFISPGGLGSNETAAAEETKKPGSSAGKETPAASEKTTAASEKTTEVPTEPPTPQATEVENTPGELPAEYVKKVNKSASREAYYGSYTGTLSVDTYNLEKLAEVSNAPAGQMDMYEALNGQTYKVTAEYKDGGSNVKVVSDEFPYTSPGQTILEAPVKEEPENGCAVKEQVIENNGYTLKNSQQVWFLSDGSLYLINAITASKGDEFVGGMVISSLLKPDK